MTILADLSRYDPEEAAGQYDGVILNVEDSGVAGKAATAHAAGRVVMLYSWVYPGQGGSVERAVGVAHSVGVPVRGIWLDYEQAGCTPNDIRAAHGSDSGGFPVGVYAYLAMMNSQGQELVDAIGDWPLWMAYYPGGNDGGYHPSYSNEARARGAVMHQWTSTNGTRDLNIVLDDAWFASWSGGSQEDDMTPEQAQLLTDVHNAIFDPNLGLQKVVVNDVPAQFKALKDELEAKIAAIQPGAGASHGTWTAG